MEQDDIGKRVVVFQPNGETVTGTITEVIDENRFKLKTDGGRPFQFSDLICNIKYKEWEGK